VVGSIVHTQAIFGEMRPNRNYIPA